MDSGDDGTPPIAVDLAMLPSAPVLVDLFNQRGIGFASTPPQARAAARALVMQACVAHSPPISTSCWRHLPARPAGSGSSGCRTLAPRMVCSC